MFTAKGKAESRVIAGKGRREQTQDIAKGSTGRVRTKKQLSLIIEKEYISLFLEVGK
jgi:hypothetical protein